MALGSLKNNFLFWTAMNPSGCWCEYLEYTDILAFSRLAGRAPQHPALRI